MRPLTKSQKKRKHGAPESLAPPPPWLGVVCCCTDDPSFGFKPYIATSKPVIVGAKTEQLMKALITAYGSQSFGLSGQSERACRHDDDESS